MSTHEALRQALDAVMALQWSGDRQRMDALHRLCQAAEAALSAAEAAQPKQSQAATDVLAERRRQIEAEGWTPEHDDEHDAGELAQAAAYYAMAGHSYERGRVVWPWDESWLKLGSTRRNLVKAAALLLAEIERLDRAAQPKEPTA